MAVDLTNTYISAEEEAKFKTLSPINLPLNPSNEGWTAEEIRAFWEAVFTNANAGVYTLLKNKTDEIHTILEKVFGTTDSDAIQKQINDRVEKTLPYDLYELQYMDNAYAYVTYNGASFKITLTSLRDLLAGDYEYLLDYVDQDVSEGSSPYYANPQVDSLKLRNPLNPGVTEQLVYGDKADLTSAKSHADMVDGNPHNTDAHDIPFDNKTLTGQLGNILNPDLQKAMEKFDTHGHAQSDITNLVSDLANRSLIGHTHDYIPTNLKGAINGVAELDGNGKVPLNQLYDSLEDIVLGTYVNATTFKDTSNNTVTLIENTIYKDVTTNMTYRSSSGTLIESKGSASQTVVDTSGFGEGQLAITDSDVQKVAEAFDVHTHTESDITDLDKYGKEEIDLMLADKLDTGVINANMNFYPTSNTCDESCGEPFYSQGFKLMVKSPNDPLYDETEVTLYTTDDRTINGTPLITSTDPDNPSIVGALVSQQGEVYGHIDFTNVTVTGRLQLVQGNSQAKVRLRFKLYNSSDLVNPIATSGWTTPVLSEQYLAFQTAVISNIDFEATDRLVSIWEAYAESTSSNPIVSLVFGGDDPTRILIPLPLEVTQQAGIISYDDTYTGYGTITVQGALEKIHDLIQENTAVIKIQRYVITNADNGDGTFSYTHLGTTYIGQLVNGQYKFELKGGIVYIPGQFRLELKINNNTSFYPNDIEVEEINETTVGLTYSLQTNDEVFIKVYQGLDSVAIEVGDGSITYQKLSQNLVTKLDNYDAHLSDTDNPHEVSAEQVPFDNSTYLEGELFYGLDEELLNLQGSLDLLNSHGHAMSKITGLIGALDGKSDTGHTHTISDVTNLQTSLSKITTTTLSQTPVLLQDADLSLTILNPLDSKSILFLQFPEITSELNSKITFDGGTTWYQFNKTGVELSNQRFAYAINNTTLEMEWLDFHSNSIWNELALKVEANHTQSISSVTGLQTNLDELESMTYKQSVIWSSASDFLIDLGYTLKDQQIFTIDVPLNTGTEDARFSFDGGVTYYDVYKKDALTHFTGEKIIGVKSYLFNQTTNRVIQLDLGYNIDFETNIIGSATVPDYAIESMLWYNTIDGGLYYYYNDGSSLQWVAVVAPASIALGNIEGLTATLTDIYAQLDSAATETYVDQKISTLIGGSPILLDTLAELASAINNDSNFYTTLMEMFAGKQAIDEYTAKYKWGELSFPLDTNTYTYNDTWITDGTFISITPTGNKLGVWEVSSYDGYFTITSSVYEQVNVTFEWNGTKNEVQ